VDNLYIYHAHGGQDLVLYQGRGLRTLGGSYVDVQGKVVYGQQVIVGNPYIVCQGPRSAINPGSQLTCTGITVDGATYQ
jgi:hypothetical protein